MKLPNGRTAKLAVLLAVVATIAQAQVAVTGFGGFSDGTAALPSVFFANDPDTGLYRIGANQWGLASNGAANLWTDANGFPSTSIGFGLASSAAGTADVQLVRGGTTGALRILAGTTPTQSGTTCGTGPTLAGNNTNGAVTLGTTPGLPCTIVFNGTWTNAPRCHLNAEILATGTTTVRATGITTTQFVITSTASLVATDKITWFCISS